MFALDTNTLIYFFKGEGRVAERLLASPPSAIAIPSVTVFEIETGIAKSSDRHKRRRQFDELLDLVAILPFDRDAATTAARIRAELERGGAPIGPFDTLIAGTALVHDATLVTRNTREFGRVRNLRVLDWLD